MNQPTQIGGRRRAGVLADMQAGLQQPMPPSISIRAQRFTLVDMAGVEVMLQGFDPQYGPYVDVIIIGANSSKSRQYYDQPYDPNNPMSPACFSDNGIAPSTASPSPQHSTCNGCPRAAWGSKTSLMTGKGIPACSSRKKLACIVAGDPTQLVYLLNVPPGSLKNLGIYAQALGQHQIQDDEGVRPVDPADVVTRVYFDPQRQGELLFQPIGYHKQMYDYVEALMEQADNSGVIDVIVGANDQPITGMIAHQPTQQLPPPQQQQLPPSQPQFQQPVAQQPAQYQQPAPQPGPQPNFQQQPAAQQPAQQQVPAQQPAPRGGRGGARAGAGRRGGAGAGQPAPNGNPGVQNFQQQQPAQRPAPQQNFQQPAQQIAPQEAQQTFQQGGGFRAAQPAPQPQQAPFVQQGGVQNGVQMPEAPAFLVRDQPAPGGAPAFGMANGSAPNADLAGAIDAAFGAPMTPRARA